MEKGIIVKGTGGFYEVKTEDDLVVCRLRGRLRLGDYGVVVGDRVEISREENGSGIVECILPRTTSLLRPPVANVDQVLVVTAAKSPNPSQLLLDRIFIHAEQANLQAVLVINKSELDPKGAQELADIYSKVPYKVILTSVIDGYGLDEVREVLQGKISTLAGASGVGKSSVINAIEPNLNLEIGNVSAKLGRGRHTTRAVELLPLSNGGLIADTPGFSRLEVSSIDKGELQGFFPEFIQYIDECQFRGCLHHREPKCAIKQAVKYGEVNELRYNNYLLFLDEIVQAEPY